MTFTDDDLNRFRKNIKDYGTGWYPFSGEELEVLLHRLEAAEKAIESANYLIGFLEFPPETTTDHRIQEFRSDFEEWLKVAGKCL